MGNEVCREADEKLDVICEHKSDGDIIPLRIRIRNEDGEYHVFSIREYRDLSHRGTYTTGDGVFVTNNTLVYECHIEVFGTQKTVKLYYEPHRSLWRYTI
jgi:hypothetical protein